MDVGQPEVIRFKFSLLNDSTGLNPAGRQREP